MHQGHPAVRDRRGALLSVQGEAVKTGDVLIKLDPTVNAAERDHLRNDLLAEQLNIARLRAASPAATMPVSDLRRPPGNTTNR